MKKWIIFTLIFILCGWGIARAEENTYYLSQKDREHWGIGRAEDSFIYKSKPSSALQFTSPSGKTAIIDFRGDKVVYSGDLPVDESAKMFFDAFAGLCKNLCYENLLGFSVKWDQKNQYLEVIGEKIHLRIYPCGKIEKLEWKVINGNEENSNIRSLPHSDFYSLPLLGR